MKTKLPITIILLLVLAAGAVAQNSIKLFDAMEIRLSDFNVLMNLDPYGAYGSVQVYLTCPTSGRPASSISGPNGGDLIVDNIMTVNDRAICDENCFTISDDPKFHIGSPMEVSYNGVRPVDVSRYIDKTGLYTFNLIDLGYTYGNNAVYLNTSCSIIPINTPTEPTGDRTLCHRNFGNGGVTITVGTPAVAAHLAHGDTMGPCGQ